MNNPKQQQTSQSQQNGKPRDQGESTDRQVKQNDTLRRPPFETPNDRAIKPCDIDNH